MHMICHVMGWSSTLQCNPQFHKQSKHIVTRWHWVQDLIQNETITISVRPEGVEKSTLISPESDVIFNV